MPVNKINNRAESIPQPGYCLGSVRLKVFDPSGKSNEEKITVNAKSPLISPRSEEAEISRNSPAMVVDL